MVAILEMYNEKNPHSNWSRDIDIILEDIIAHFLQTVYAIEKLLAGFNVQPRIGMNQSLI